MSPPGVRGGAVRAGHALCSASVYATTAGRYVLYDDCPSSVLRSGTDTDT